MVAHIRHGRPFLQVIETRRLMTHSKGDDNRPRHLVEDSLRTTDPLFRLLQEDEGTRHSHGRRRGRGPGAERHPASSCKNENELHGTRSSGGSAGISPVLQALSPPGRSEELNRALHEMMAENPAVVLIGRRTGRPLRWCLQGQPRPCDRVPRAGPLHADRGRGHRRRLNAMALASCKPVAEIMFADFVTLSADQLVNFAAKFHAMYAAKVTCPLTVSCGWPPAVAAGMATPTARAWYDVCSAASRGCAW